MPKQQNLTFTDETVKIVSYEAATGKSVDDGNSAKKERVKINKVDNVMGSSAGAGSGEFHTYRNLRRKEMFRLSQMEKEAENAKKESEFTNRIQANKTDDEKRTTKNALKRQRQKQRKLEARKRKKSQSKNGGASKEDKAVVEAEGAIDGIIAANPEKVNAFVNDGSFIEQALAKAKAEKTAPKWKGGRISSAK